MILRFVFPMLSLFAVPTIVGIVAVTQLVSLDGLVQKSAGLPIPVQPQNAPEELIQSAFSSGPPATTIAVQTEQERYNTTLSQIQDGDWLTQQGKFQAAKAVYYQALSQTQNADLAATATDRLGQLSRQLSLKPVVKSAVKPVVKLVLKPVVKPIIKSVNKPALNSIPQSLISPITNPIANSSVSRSATDLLPISQPTSPAAPQLGQLPSSETLLPAQTIVAESPQWDPEPPAQLN